jgi:hypothetical protein
MPPRYNSTTKFWNFVDDSLSAMRRIADESSSIVTEQEKELQKYVFISRHHYTN